MAMKFDSKTLAIIAGVVIVFMVMQSDTQAVGEGEDITTDTVIEKLKETALTILDNLVSRPMLLLGIVGGIVAIVILGK